MMLGSVIVCPPAVECVTVPGVVMAIYLSIVLCPLLFPAAIITRLVPLAGAWSVAAAELLPDAPVVVPRLEVLLRLVNGVFAASVRLIYDEPPVLFPAPVGDRKASSDVCPGNRSGSTILFLRFPLSVVARVPLC
jgi:hypothetical protein